MLCFSIEEREPNELISSYFIFFHINNLESLYNMLKTHKKDLNLNNLIPNKTFYYISLEKNSINNIKCMRNNKKKSEKEMSSCQSKKI